MSSDPIQFCYRYNHPQDIELIGLISALFSYGNVSSICKFLERLLSCLGRHPSQHISNISSLSFRKNSFLFYRFQTSEDIFEFVITLYTLWLKTKTFQIYFLSHNNLNQGIANFQEEFWKTYKEIFAKEPSYGLKFLVGIKNPKGSHKRLWMFLRWMTRRTFPDFGIYTALNPKDLIYPLDTHIIQFASFHEISKRKTNDFVKAQEITNWFKKYSFDDPLIFDFPISRLGILKENNLKNFMFQNFSN